MTDPDLLNPGCWVFTDSRGVPVPGVTVTSVKLRREPEKASGIGDIACTLNKVLPADTGPLVRSTWTCPVCGMEYRGGPPDTCGWDNPDCPIG
jgi:hypothetical protein